MPTFRPCPPVAPGTVTAAALIAVSGPRSAYDGLKSGAKAFFH